MGLLLSGVLLFAGVHFIPSMAPKLKSAWRKKMGEGGYKGSFSLLLLAAFALIILGWRSIAPALLYLPPQTLRLPALALIVVAFVLLVIANRNSRLRQWIRHPQLTGVLLWASAHLMLNGDNRSVLLFGGIGLWALLEIFSISKREGAWVKPDIPAWSSEVMTLVIALAAVIAMAFAHPYIAGMPILPV